MYNFHIPERPYGPIDALNRRAAALGSPGYAQRAAYADYNGHCVTVHWNDYRQYYIAEYFWAGRVVLARGEFSTCLEAALREFDRGALGSAVDIAIRPGDERAVALVRGAARIAGILEGPLYVQNPKAGNFSYVQVDRAWFTWRHEMAAGSVRDYANPRAPRYRFDWALMQAAETREEYVEALRAKYRSEYEY